MDEGRRIPGSGGGGRQIPSANFEIRKCAMGEVVKRKGAGSRGDDSFFEN